MPAAPAPQNTTLISSIFFPTIASAFNNAAPEMMAVPCWSSWKTGILIDAFSSSSMRKHSGALMSSRLIPPNVGSSARTMRTISPGSMTSSSMSKTSMSANRLKRTAFPSITGLPANAPMLPSPKTAVPFETTATRFPLAV